MTEGKVTLINDLGGREIRAESIGEQVVITIERAYMSPELVHETLCGFTLDAAGAAQLGKRLQVLADGIAEEA